MLTAFSLLWLSSVGFFIVFVDRVANPTDQFDARIGCDGAPRMTSPARAITRLFSSFRDLEKANLFPPWSACRAGGAAINSSRAHSKDKTAVT